MMDLLSLGRDLIAANTVSHRGTDAAVALLKPLYAAAGFQVEVQEVVRGDARHQNLLGTYPGGDAGGLLLVTHLDTVDAGPSELWTETGGQPLRLVRKGDRLYGLGSADTKLDALCKLVAASEFRGRALRRTLQLLGTFEEEVGCKGARHFAASSALRARFVSCSEPSELAIIRAHKGYAVVRVRLTLPNAPLVAGPFVPELYEGKSAHSSTPALGINAIERALDALAQRPVVALEGGTVSNKVPARCTATVPGTGATSPPRADASAVLALSRSMYRAWCDAAAALQPTSNPTFDPAGTVTNWGVARVEGPSAELTFDCRLLPGHRPEALLEDFAARAQKLAHAGAAVLEIDIDRASPAMELREPSELLVEARAACRDVGLSDQPQAKPTNTEAGVFAQAGVEAIVFGPGRSTGNAHTPNEHNLYSQLEKAIEFYRALITRLCVA